MKAGYFPTEFEIHLKTFMDSRENPPWFRLAPLIHAVPQDSQLDFVPCLYLLVLFDQSTATYRLALQPPWGRRDKAWNLGASPNAFPKYGPGGVSRAHVPPHEIFAESCRLGLHQEATLYGILVNDFASLLPDANKFLELAGSSLDVNWLFGRIIQDHDVAVSENRNRREDAPSLKQSVYKALVDARSHLPDTLWSRI